MSKEEQVFRSFLCPLLQLKSASNINLNLVVLPINSNEQMKIQWWINQRDTNINLKLLEQINVRRKGINK